MSAAQAGDPVISRSRRELSRSKRQNAIDAHLRANRQKPQPNPVADAASVGNLRNLPFFQLLPHRERIVTSVAQRGISPSFPIDAHTRNKFAPRVPRCLSPAVRPANTPPSNATRSRYGLTRVWQSDVRAGAEGRAPMDIALILKCAPKGALHSIIPFDLST